MRGVLTQDQKQMAFRLKAEGLSLKEIARQVGCTAPMVGSMVRDGRFLTGLPDTWQPRPGLLMIREREQALLGLAAGESGARSPAGWGGLPPGSPGRSRPTGAGRVTGRGLPTSGPGRRSGDPSPSGSPTGRCWSRSASA